MGLKKTIFTLGVGIIAGLLCAPKKGTELREDIKSGTKKAIEKSKTLTKEDVIAAMNSSYEKVVKAIEEFDVEEVKAETKTKLDELKVKAEELKGQAEELATKVKENEKVNEVLTHINEVAKTTTDKINEIKDKVVKEGKELTEEIQAKLNKVVEEAKEEIDELKEELEEVKEEVTEETTEEVTAEETSDEEEN